MASVEITAARLPLNAGAALPVLTALTSATDGALIAFSDRDTKTVILVKNTGAAAKTVTFKKGDSIQGVADLTEPVAAGETRLFVLESGRHKFVSGDKKGKVHAVGESLDLQFGAVVLP